MRRESAVNRPAVLDGDGLDGIYDLSGPVKSESDDLESPKWRWLPKMWIGVFFTILVGFLIAYFASDQDATRRVSVVSGGKNAVSQSDYSMFESAPEISAESIKIPGDKKNMKPGLGSMKPQNPEIQPGVTKKKPIAANDPKSNPPKTVVTSSANTIDSQSLANKNTALNATTRSKRGQISAPPPGNRISHPLQRAQILPFSFNSAGLSDSAKQQSVDLASFVSGCKQGVEVVGHTCNIGHRDVNLALGLARAKTVKTLLISKGVDDNRIIMRSEGDKEPLASNRTPIGRAKNRRVEIHCSES